MYSTVSVGDGAVGQVRDAARTECETSSVRETRVEIADGLLESAPQLVNVLMAVMNREFDEQATLEMLDRRGVTYVVLFDQGKDRYLTERKLHSGRNE